MIVIVMGVSGSGKSTVGELLASKMGWDFRDGDSFHPAANVAKMKSGIPLNDDDRRPWLLAIQNFMRETLKAGGNAVIACSALKDGYRRLLLCGEPGVQFAHLHGSKELIASRMQRRQGHFMPTTLLDSQFASLEATPDLPTFEITASPEVLVDQIRTRLGLPGTPP